MACRDGNFVLRVLTCGRPETHQELLSIEKMRVRSRKDLRLGPVQFEDLRIVLGRKGVGLVLVRRDVGSQVRFKLESFLFLQDVLGNAHASLTIGIGEGLTDLFVLNVSIGDGGNDVRSLLFDRSDFLTEVGKKSLP